MHAESEERTAVLASGDLEPSDAGRGRIPASDEPSLLTGCLHANHLRQWTEEDSIHNL